ncbi:hypothetical protein Van01_30210 [Micromonospora andamanensis]|uniref:Uncharacterized protein n=1 Tax=Micromonospora andamanensis TaxID=1287068 RepID=A0ABQ4HVZ9_9ACTN|nr:hypothetical protein Van01_30210 [Micromonospora andamanensis]
MRIRPGLSPKLVTSVSEAAYAGLNVGTTRPAATSDTAKPSSNFLLIFTDDSFERLFQAGFGLRVVLAGTPNSPQ